MSQLPFDSELEHSDLNRLICFLKYCNASLVERPHYD